MGTPDFFPSPPSAPNMKVVASFVNKRRRLKRVRVFVVLLFVVYLDPGRVLVQVRIIPYIRPIYIYVRVYTSHIYVCKYFGISITAVYEIRA